MEVELKNSFGGSSLKAWRLRYDNWPWWKLTEYALAMREYQLPIHDKVEMVSVLMRQRETPLGTFCGNAKGNSLALQWP